LEFLLNIPIVEIAAGTTAFLLLLLVLRRLVGDREIAGLSGEISRDARAAIRQYRRSGDELGVAKVLFREGQYGAAAEIFTRLGNHGRAAKSFERANKIAMAIQAYKRAGHHERAAQVALKNHMYLIAAKEFEELDQLEKAAECFVKAEDPHSAADIYETLGRYKESGVLFGKLGIKEKAAKMYLKHFEEEFRLHRGDLSAIPDACKVARRAAGVLLDIGRKKDAADVLNRAGYSGEAADLYVQAGALAEAAQTHLDAKRLLKAAEIYEEMGDMQSAAKFRAEALLSKGDTLSAAHDFALSGDYIRAAELYIESQDQHSAAEMYKLGGDAIAAAEIYAQAGDMERAADLYAEANEPEEAARIWGSLEHWDKAADLWEVAGNYLESGLTLYRSNNHPASLKMLERVSEFGDDARQARALQGRILFDMGKPDLAHSKFRDALDDEEPAPHNIELIYEMGRCAESLGSLKDALERYEKVLGVDRTFSNTRERVKEIKQQLKVSAEAIRTTGVVVAARVAPMPDGVAANKLAKSRYEILDEIARGGMGIVYRARDKVLNRIVAFKILSETLKTNKTAVEYFLREARAAAAMSHSNIVTVFDAGEQDGDYYMAMEYVEGETLKHLVRKKGSFPEKLLRFVAIHSCRGLDYAHKRRLVHRDIKSGNLMFTKDKMVKIMDFGLAKFIEEHEADHTRAIGTPYYMSPEQILGKELDGRSDLYSLGITLFECATGKVPFAKGDLSYHHLHTAPPRAKDLNSKLSDEMDDLIAKCIRKKPDERYQSASDILKQLK
jgi:tetratricopeptide (TPR) repeat protein